MSGYFKEDKLGNVKWIEPFRPLLGEKDDDMRDLEAIRYRIYAQLGMLHYEMQDVIEDLKERGLIDKRS